MYRSAREHPSFSSSLLDEIYRSFDERDDRKSASYRETTRPKQSNNYYQHNMIENWKVKEVTNHSSSSSSDSSSGGGFSSSETESVYCKPIRTNKNRHDVHSSKQMNAHQQQEKQQQQQQQQRYRLNDTQPKQKQEGKFVKTKSRAMKIYGDLKKAKQPISPGGKLATFLNSIFTSSNTKSTKLSSTASIESKSATASTCSSASSFSRSCLSKTPSSRGKLSNNKKRSVRFYPVSVIVGDDCQPCGHKSLYSDESSLHALKIVKKPKDDEPRVYSNEKTRRIEEAARNLLRNYQKKVDLNQLITGNVASNVKADLSYEDDEDEDEDEDDVASNTSSDLFELENFSAIGMENYGDELPVYETTRLDTCSLR
ncbi:protein BIG GRAIN 1-like B [Bidens hawaiensis]|uniref:protein BIG GRAIN 1-like B n=1 Tax=Bidens hawaiensis TaxID=980011 RepID=UPI00404ADCC5